MVKLITNLVDWRSLARLGRPPSRGLKDSARPAKNRGLAQIVSALDWGSRGRRGGTGIPDQGI